MTTKTKAKPAKQPLLQAPLPVTLAGETFQIKQFPFGQVHLVSAKLLPIFGAFQMQEGQSIELGELMASGGESLMDVLAMAIDRPREFLDTIDYDEGKELLAAVLKANAALAKKALPDLLKMMTGKAPATVATPAT